MSSKLKIDISKINELKDNKNMSISFEYLTNNKEYNLDYFIKSKDKNNELKFLENLFYEIKILTSNTFMKYMGSDRRKTGFEKINNINFEANIKINRDENIYSKRIKNDYRMIFIFRDNTIYVIGFDFNFSAYKH